MLAGFFRCVNRENFFLSNFETFHTEINNFKTIHKKTSCHSIFIIELNQQSV